VGGEKNQSLKKRGSGEGEPQGEHCITSKTGRNCQDGGSMARRERIKREKEGQCHREKGKKEGNRSQRLERQKKVKKNTGID